jgi:hypothetical protein
MLVKTLGVVITETILVTTHSTKKLIYFFVALLLWLFAVASFTTSDAFAYSERINYQGKLLSASSTPVANDSYSMTFRLYTSISGGSPVWTETRTAGNAVPISNGLFSVMLGELESLSDIDFSQILYLGVTIGSDSEMSPRKPLGTVPSAFLAGRAIDANAVGGVASTSLLRNDSEAVLNATSTSTLFSFIQNGSGAIARFFAGATEVFSILNNGNVGVGTSTPDSRLVVDGDIFVTGAFRDSSNTAGAAGYILQTTGSGTEWVSTSTLGFGSSNVSMLNDLADVDILSPLAGQLLSFNGSDWVNISTSSLNIDGSRWNISGSDISYTTGNVGIGTSTPNTTLSLDKRNITSGVAGIGQFYTITSNTPSQVAYSNRMDIINDPTEANAAVGSFITIADNSGLSNVVRGIEVQTDRGTSTAGENTALSGIARTFGVRGITRGDAGGVFEPAGGFFETQGTVQGNAIRGFSDTITTANLAVLFHSDSVFSGTGLQMTFGNSGGTFTGNFLDLRNSSNTQFSVSATGTTRIAGDLLLNGKLRDSSSSFGVTGYILQSTATGTQWVATSSLGIVGGGGGGATNLNDLSDVTLTTPSTGQLLSYNGSSWVNVATSTLSIALTDTTGTLSVTRGGTGLTSVTQNQLVIGGAGNTLVQIATSSLGIVLTDTTGTLSVTRGGTGLTSLVAGDLLFASATDTLDRRAIGTTGQVLQVVAGVPQWVATSTLGIGSSNVTNLNDLSDVTLTTPSTGQLLSYNGSSWVNVATSTLSIALTDTTGTLSVTRGGTGLTSVTQNQLVIGGAGNTLVQIATSSLGIVLTDTTGTLSVTRGGTGLTSLVAGDLLFASATDTLDRRAIGTTGQVLQVVAGVPQWVATSTLGIVSGGSNWDLSGSNISYTTGNVGIGTSTPNTILTLDKRNFQNGVAGIGQFYSVTSNSVSDVVFGNRMDIVNSPTAANAMVGSFITVADSSGLANVVRGIEVQTDRGNNTLGENTALSGIARTFGVRGVTRGDAGGVAEPAGGIFETQGTTQGNAIRGFSESITSANLAVLFQSVSSFSGTGLQMSFGNSGGTFTGNFLDLRNSSNTQFSVTATGTVRMVGNLGVGLLSPSERLHVRGGNVRFDDSTDAAGFFFERSTGRLGLGTTTPASRLTVAGDIRGTGELYLSGLPSPISTNIVLCHNTTDTRTYVGASATSCTPSSIQYKNSVSTSTNSLSILRQLRTVTFYFNDNPNSEQHLGFIAEEVADVDTRLVQFDNENNPGALKLDNFIGMLVGSVQELDEQVQISLETRDVIDVLLGLGTTTASSTIGLISEAAPDSLWNKIVSFFEGFVDGILTIAGIKTEKIETEELCIEDICVNADSLRQIIDSTQTTSTQSYSSGTTSSDSSSDPESDPDPEPEPEPEPEPSPEPDPETEE